MPEVNRIMSPSKDESESQWCLVGNVVGEHPYGEGGLETRHGTKHFSSGTKVFALPSQWGDDYEDIVVIGRHRGSKKFVMMVMPAAYVTNWRAKVVYHPEVLGRLTEATEEAWQRNWTSENEVKKWVEFLVAREASTG